MEISKFATNHIFNIPKSRGNVQDFRKYLNEMLDEYTNKLNKVTGIEFLDNDYTFDFDIEFMKEKSRELAEGIKETVKYYYQGNPFKAYEKLNSTLREGKDFYQLLRKHSFQKENNFYRIRTKSDNYLYSKENLFHIPFDLRGKVATQRFSIPGFPSLYLGNSLYVCWEELGRPNINEIQFVRILNTEPLSCLDLTSKKIKIQNNQINREQYRYIVTFPIIIACSIKVKERNDDFKPEYIIPQLLLQWVRNNDSVDGIRYSSTHIDNSVSNGIFDNIVFPVKTMHSKGYCNILVDTFQVSDAISWQILQFSTGGKTFLYSSNNRQNDDEPSIQLIKGKKYPYSYSVLSMLEKYLDSVETTKIKNNNH